MQIPESGNTGREHTNTLTHSKRTNATLGILEKYFVEFRPRVINAKLIVIFKCFINTRTWCQKFTNSEKHFRRHLYRGKYHFVKAKQVLA